MSRKKIKELFKNPSPTNLLTFQLLISVFAFFQVWIMQYQSDDGNPGLIQRVSFRVIDPPFMLNPETLIPVLYKHYFGDWQNVLDVANQSNPYLNFDWPSQTPPLGNIFLETLFIIGPRYSFFVFSLFTLMIWIWLFHRVFAAFPFLYTVLGVSLYFILTLPSVYSFDRGALHMFAAGMIGVAWLKYSDKKYSQSLCFFVLAISMKPQMSLVLLLLLVKFDYRNILRAIVATISINFLLLIFYGGDLFRSLIGYLKATFFFVSASASGYIMDSGSLTGFLTRRIESARGTEFTLSWMSAHSTFLVIPGVALLLFVIPIMFFKNTNQRVKIFLVLSLFSLVVPSSLHYTMTWASLAIIPFLTDTFNFVSANPTASTLKATKRGKTKSDNGTSLFDNWRLADFICLLTITLILTPSFAVHWTGVRNISISRDLYPCLVLVAIVTVYLENFIFPKFKSMKEIRSI